MSWGKMRSLLASSSAIRTQKSWGVRMSAALVRSQIRAFLSTRAAEVLCVKGKWGVGKTFTWKDELRQSEQIALDRYAYVSLFGVNSLNELKYAIFENTIKREQIAKGASIDTLKDALKSAERMARKRAWMLNAIPWTRNAFAAIAPGFFLTIRDQIVCLDDLERKGKNLDAGDVFGLISFLKEERRCKVVLLLNDEALEGNDRVKFDSYLEKVVDVTLAYNPTAQESIQVAIPGADRQSRQIADNCALLGISNIRVIQKIHRVVRAIAPMLSAYDDEVLQQVIRALALFCWSHYQPGEAPTIQYLTTKKAKDVFGLGKDANLTPKESAWNALLDAYGYVWTDEFDLVLIDGVQNGYFDPEKIETCAQNLQDKVRADRAEGSFSQAWRKYHDSFANDKDDVLDELYASFMVNFQYITPLNLNGTVMLFKELGRSQQATEMVQHYVNNRDEPREFFDLNEYSFEITDQEVVDAFRRKWAEMEESRDIRAMLLSLKDGWSDEALSALAVLPVDEYYRRFKDTAGQELRTMIAACLQFDRIINATPHMKEIANRAREALKLIGKESDINARRVRKFGVIVEDS